MSSEHFIKYLKNPKLLNEVTYEELSQLREKYPYSHILHYLLFLKSQESPADLEEHKKNASIFAVDNNKIFEEIKQFQELEQKPTDKHTMDDLFDLSEDDEDVNSASQNERTPSNDSEEIKTHTSPIDATEKSQPRIIREQRYIPLDPSIYEMVDPNKTVHARPSDEEKVVPKPPEENNSTEENFKADSKSNVFFIDALINLDSSTDRIELVSNKDAYKEVTDTPIYAPEEDEIVEEEIIENEIFENEPTLELDTILHEELSEELDEEVLASNTSIPMEITNEKEEVLESDIVETSITDSEGSIPENEVVEEENLETKKSFDNWVRKKDVEKEKKKSTKKKKKKKDKIPPNAKESLKETDIIASETLAELLIKQGRNKKAIKVYERLCLIFPQKSNYFAQIIKNLKEKS